MTEIKQKCENCRFFVPPPLCGGEFPHGICRRHAPTMTINENSCFPYTNPDFWCGDYEPKS